MHVGDLRSKTTGLANRLLPGIGKVASQVDPYAQRWEQSNCQALATDFALWVILGDPMSQGTVLGASKGMSCSFPILSGRTLRLLRRRPRLGRTVVRWNRDSTALAVPA